MKKKLLWVLMIVLSCLLMFSSCSQFKQGGELRGDVEQMLDALIEDDFAPFYARISGACSEEEAQNLFPQMRDYLNGAATYQLELYHMSARVDNGVQTREEIYFVKTDVGNFYISIKTSSEVEGLCGFQIATEEEAGLSPSSTGTVLSMAGASAIQWIVLIVALLQTAFLVFTVVDCARRKIRKKALWILLILLVSVSAMLTISSGKLNFNFNFGFFLSHTALIIYSNGTKLLRLYLPIGAIIYWCCRKKLLQREDTEVLPTAELLSEDYNVNEAEKQGDQNE